MRHRLKTQEKRKIQTQTPKRRKNMKQVKRLLSLVLAVAMTLCLGIVAMADTETSSTTTTHTYQLYQIFTGTVSNGTITDIKWGQNCTDAATKAGTAVKESDLTELNNAYNAENANDQTRLTAVKKYADLNSTPYRTSNTTSFSNVAAGYYLIKDHEDSIADANDVAHTLYVVKVTEEGTLTFTPKSGVPTVEKKIIENETALDENDAAIGDTVHYQITGTLPSNYDSYTTYSYTFTDNLSSGLTYNGSVNVYLRTSAGEELIGSTNYTVTAPNEDNNNTLTISFANLKTVTTNENAEIVVLYSATLNTNAVIGGTGNSNTVTLTYSNNPNGTGTGTTTPDTVVTKTWSFPIHKYAAGDSTKANLAGAEFKLSKDASGTHPISLVKINDTQYRVAVPGETSLVEKVTTVATGNLVIQGLDSGTYYLTEVKAPDTYVKLTAPIQIKIESDGTVKLVTTTTTGTGDNAQTSTVETAVSEISVANNKITATLPTTGGMGTTAIYIAGGLMMMAAAILLIVKKQTNK
jgi:fimbrial isopeptide formation D2 family protein/LPXTG-motif cell wall-anchored protein